MKKVYKRHKKPSERQLKVVALLEANPEMTPTEAARLAGYAPNTVKNAGVNIIQKPLVKSLLDNYQYELTQHNINPARLATKMDELLESSFDLRDKRTGEVIASVPNHKIQLGAVKLLHEVYGVKADTKPAEGLKRRMVLEEFDEKEVLQG